MAATHLEDVDAIKKRIVQLLDPQVIDDLDVLYPERTPELTDSIDRIRYASGQRSVIHFLRGLVNGSASSQLN